MRRSVERILTSHTGSLPRPDELLELMLARESGQAVDAAQLARAVQGAVASVVQRQADVGLDVVNDGEMSKVGFMNYVKDRLASFGGGRVGREIVRTDVEEFPTFAQRLAADRRRGVAVVPSCDGPITYQHPNAYREDVANLQAALDGVTVEEAFLSAASPGIVAAVIANTYYPSYEAYLYAIADAMKEEYDAIAAAGFVLQLDCPDLAMGHHTYFAGRGIAEFRDIVRLNLQALDHAVRDVAPEQLRLHVCWGNYEGPHHHDVALRDVLDLVLAARPAGVSFEACNPRHAHEWRVFEDVKVPEGKVLMPGVIDSTTNFIEHPELVAERICRFAGLVGREAVIAGTDCGFATLIGRAVVDPEIAWAKLRALAEGARLASRQLW
jgi:5-methyltetrahydropteroyltriglutamate--homocysteine methyltransferase